MATDQHTIKDKYHETITIDEADQAQIADWRARLRGAESWERWLKAYAVAL
jgi:hypothetical protein